MSGELFDVAFSGQVSEGADREAVKARIGKMFKAEGAKLEQLFSGKRIVVKRNVDEATAQKFVEAFRSAGAEAEAEPQATPPAASEPAPAPAAPPPPGPRPSAGPPPDAGSPPSTAPLGVTADQINDLDATLAPPGEELQDGVEKVPEPQYDLSALEMAPVGSDLSDDEKKPPPPPPDTSGLSLVD